MGIISGAKSQMQKSLGLSCSNLEWVVSLLPVGGFVASITGGNDLKFKTTKSYNVKRFSRYYFNNKFIKRICL